MDLRRERPLQRPGSASPSQEPAGKQRVGGMNLTCRWTESKGSYGAGEGEAGAGMGMGYRSVPGLPRLRAEGRGMIFSHCLGGGFLVRVVLCVATPLWGCSDPCRSGVFTAGL